MSELLDAVITAHGGLDLRPVVRRTSDGPLLSGRTSFVLDYTSLEVRT